jgi:hypothetical protein
MLQRNRFRRTAEYDSGAEPLSRGEQERRIFTTKNTKITKRFFAREGAQQDFR